MKKSKAIGLVLLAGLGACSNGDGKYVQKTDTVSQDALSGHIFTTVHYYWVPYGGTPVIVTPEEFNSYKGSSFRNGVSSEEGVSRGGFGGSAAAHGEGEAGS